MEIKQAIEIVKNGDFKRLNAFELWELETLLKDSGSMEANSALKIIKAEVDEKTIAIDPVVKENIEALNNLLSGEDAYNPMDSTQDEDVIVIKKILDEKIVVDNNAFNDGDVVTKKDVKEDLTALSHLQAQEAIIQNTEFAKYNKTQQKNAYRLEFINAMQTNIAVVALNHETGKIKNTEVTKEVVENKIKDLFASPSEVKISNVSFIGTLKAATENTKAFSNKLTEKVGINKYSQKVKAFDEKIGKKYPILWGALKNTTAYTVAAAVPCGLFALTGYNLYKTANRIKDDAKNNNTTFFKQAFSSSSATANSVASLTGAVVVGAEVFGAFAEPAAKAAAMGVRAFMGLSAAAVSAGEQVYRGVVSKDKEERKARFAKAKVIGASAFAGTIIGITLGKLAGTLDFNLGDKFKSVDVDTNAMDSTLNSTEKTEAQVVEKQTETKTIETKTTEVKTTETNTQTQSKEGQFIVDGNKIGGFQEMEVPSQYSSDMGITKSQFNEIRSYFNSNENNYDKYYQMLNDDVMKVFEGHTREEVLFEYAKLEQWTGAGKFVDQEVFRDLKAYFDCGDVLSVKELQDIKAAFDNINDDGSHKTIEGKLNVRAVGREGTDCDEVTKVVTEKVTSFKETVRASGTSQTFNTGSDELQEIYARAYEQARSEMCCDTTIINNYYYYCCDENPVVPAEETPVTPVEEVEKEEEGPKDVIVSNKSKTPSAFISGVLEEMAKQQKSK